MLVEGPLLSLGLKILNLFWFQELTHFCFGLQLLYDGPHYHIISSTAASRDNDSHEQSEIKELSCLPLSVSTGTFSSSSFICKGSLRVSVG